MLMGFSGEFGEHRVATFWTCLCCGTLRQIYTQLLLLILINIFQTKKKIAISWYRWAPSFFPSFLPLKTVHPVSVQTACVNTHVSCNCFFSGDYFCHAIYGVSLIGGVKKIHAVIFIYGLVHWWLAKESEYEGENPIGLWLSCASVSCWLRKYLHKYSRS